MIVAAGETLLLPVAATVPTPPLMDTEVAPLTVQLSVELPPALILAGLAVKELMTGFEGAGCCGGGGAAPTVTVAVLVTGPAALVAVRV